MSSGSTLPVNQDSQPPSRERRKRVRQRAQSPAFAAMNSNSTGIELDLHQILDLSEDGMAFQSSGPMEIGELLEFSLDLSDPKAYLHTAGRVMWSNGAGRTGVRFQKIAPEDASQLREWLVANVVAGVESDERGDATVDASAPIDSIAPVLKADSEVTAAPALLPSPIPSPIPSEETPSPFHSYVSGLLASEDVKQEVETLAFDLDSALQIVVQRALSLTRATGAAIALSAEEEMVCRATSGLDAPPLGARLQVGSGFSGECVRTGQLLHCDDSETDDRVDRESCRALDIRSIMAAPIKSETGVIGLVEIFSPDAGAFEDSDKTVLQGMAEIVLDAVERAVRSVGEKEPALSASGQQKYSEHSLLAADDLVRSMAEGNAAVSEPEPLKPSFPARRRKIPWVLIVALGIGVLVAAWLIFTGWRDGFSHTPRQSRLSGQSQDLNRQVSLEASSLQDLKDMASRGDTLAQFTLGLRYATGSDAPQDYSEAVRWFSVAAQQGHVMAQSTLGAYYWAGRGVPQDFRKAYFWALLAQSAGDDASRARVPFLVSRLTRGDLVAVQHQAEDWMNQHRVLNKPSPAKAN